MQNLTIAFLCIALLFIALIVFIVSSPISLLVVAAVAGLIALIRYTKKHPIK